MNQDKVTQAKTILSKHWYSPALMCSFGKDSMVLLHLIRETLKPRKFSCHGYPVPIISHRHPWFPAKNEFADSVIRSWALEVHDWLPGACGVKANADRLELVARYPFGKSAMDIPMNIEQPIHRRDFVCGLSWIVRPKMHGVFPFPWRNVFMGHKSSDVDQYEGHVPLKSNAAEVGGITIVFPLRDWTDDDVWDYIEENHVPYDERRYKDRREIDDHWLNSDYLHACTACVDPRDKSEKVFCPKVGDMVDNRGSEVLRLDNRPEYIERKQVAA
jgi:3'-phosphoadenosine 5'-phosphosulfate sulfotransferase (PAPS reductase)/FAD synthetase